MPKRRGEKSDRQSKRRSSGDTSQTNREQNNVQKSAKNHVVTAPEPELNNTAERRELRHQYRQLIHDTKHEQNELEAGSQSNKHYLSLKQANDLFSHVANPREAALDSELLYLCASLGKQKIQSLQTDFIQFQPLELAEKLITTLSQTAESSSADEGHDSPFPLSGWEKFGKLCSPFFSRSPHLHFMSGSISTNSLPKPKKVQAKRAHNTDDEAVPATAPLNVNEGLTETTTEEVERILSVLHHVYKRNGNEPVCFFEFIINPHSFNLTVENLFHVSFLIKDGYAAIFHDADKLPCIAPVIEKPAETNEPVKRNQVIIPMTIATWKELIETFEISEPLIPEKKTSKSPRKKKQK